MRGAARRCECSWLRKNREHGWAGVFSLRAYPNVYIRYPLASGGQATEEAKSSNDGEGCDEAPSPYTIKCCSCMPRALKVSNAFSQVPIATSCSRAYRASRHPHSRNNSRSVFHPHLFATTTADSKRFVARSRGVSCVMKSLLRAYAAAPALCHQRRKHRNAWPC